MKVNKTISLDVTDCDYLNKKPEGASKWIQDRIQEEKMKRTNDKFEYGAILAEEQERANKKQILKNYYTVVPRLTRRDIENLVREELNFNGDKYTEAPPEFWEACYKKAKEKGFDVGVG